MDADAVVVERGGAVLTVDTTAVPLGRSGPYHVAAWPVLEESRGEGLWHTEQLQVNASMVL